MTIEILKKMPEEDLLNIKLQIEEALLLPSLPHPLLKQSDGFNRESAPPLNIIIDFNGKI